MKKLIAAAAVVLVLAGCGATLTPEEQYALEIQREMVGADTVSPRKLIEVGNKTCEVLETGVTELTLLRNLPNDSGFTRDEKAFLIHSAHKNLCPEF